MKLSKIINMKNNAKKLEAIVTLVTAARAKYNNSDMEITAPKITTASGCQNIKYLETNDKAAVAAKELREIMCTAQQLDEEMEGVNVNREITSLIATNPTLANLEDSLSLELE